MHFIWISNPLKTKSSKANETIFRCGTPCIIYDDNHTVELNWLTIIIIIIRSVTVCEHYHIKVMLLPYINLLFSFCKDLKEVDSFILSYLPENLFNFLHFLFQLLFSCAKEVTACTAWSRETFNELNQCSPFKSVIKTFTPFVFHRYPLNADECPTGKNMQWAIHPPHQGIIHDETAVRDLIIQSLIFGASVEDCPPGWEKQTY